LLKVIIAVSKSKNFRILGADNAELLNPSATFGNEPSVQQDDRLVLAKLSRVPRIRSSKVKSPQTPP
jgi:hypothetical protein